MRRFRTYGGSMNALKTFNGSLPTTLLAANSGKTLADFYTTREQNIKDINTQILKFIKIYLKIANASDADIYKNAPEYEQLTTDLDTYGRETLRTAFGINRDAPTAMDPYLPTFVAYDFLNIKADTEENPVKRNKLLRLAGMIRTVLPTVDPENFSKWETYYRDFKIGKYSGGLTKWRARKAADTPYDPVDPIFDFDQQPRVKIPRVSPSSYATGDALYTLGVEPPTRTAIRDGKTDIIKGGFSRRSVRSSRRRF